MVVGKIKIIIAMLIFGTIGIFVRGINLSSMEIAFFRSLIGSLFLLGVYIVSKQKISIKNIKNNLVLLVCSGVAIGINWIFLFQAYKYTSISNATLSYYFAPVFVGILSPLVLKEKFSKTKFLSIIIAMIGLVIILVSQQGMGSGNYNHLKGVSYGLLAAVLYASVILMNKFIKDLGDFETTLIQLMSSGIVLLPILVYQGNKAIAGLDTKGLVQLLILGVLHTGVAYLLYFSSLKDLNGQSIAVFSYIDPIFAVIFASIFLAEGITIYKVIGGVLILGATFVSEKNDM